MKTTNEMGGTELLRKLEKFRKISDEITSEFISTGRGYERPSETINFSDPLSLRWKENARIVSDLLSEIDRRKTYSGTLKKIK